MFTRRYFEDLYSRLKLCTCLVFDNCHEVDQDSSFHELMVNGLAVIPDGIHAIFISRGEPPPSYARLLLDRKMERMGAEDLNLTPEESYKIICLRLERSPARRLPAGEAGAGGQLKEVADEIHRKAGGWVAGVVLMGEKVREEGVDSIKKIDPHTISGYFTSEVLSRLDSDTRLFLLKTAFLQGIDSRTAEKLTGVSNGEEILSSLNRNNWFTERRPGPSSIYQYHPLFREFLLSRAMASFPDHEIRSLKQKAAEVLEESGKLEEAFGLLAECGDWNSAAAIVIKHAPEFASQGRFVAMERLIKVLPSAILESVPWLLYWFGVCRMPFNLEESRIYFEKAFDLARERRDPFVVYLAWAGMVDSLTIGLNDLKGLDAWIPIIDEIINSFGGFPSERLEAKVASSMFMALVYRQPQHPDAESWGKRALELSEKCGDVILQMSAISNYAMHKMHLGELDEALLAINSHRHLVQSQDVRPLDLVVMKWIEAMYAAYTASYKDCMRIVSEGLKLSADTGVYVMDFLLLGQGCLSALDARDLKTANGFLDRMGSLPGIPPGKKGKGYYRYLLAYEALLQGETNQALLHAEDSLRQAIETGFPLATSLCHLELAHILWELKDRRRAVDHLKEGERLGRMIQFRYAEFIALLQAALFALDRGDKEGISILRKGLELGRKCGYVATHTWHPDQVARLCCWALEEGIEVGYVQNLIRKHHLRPSASSLEIENWPWEVKIYTLGRFSVFNEKRVGRSRKIQQRPIAMLKAILALGGRDIGEEQLVDILWPESDGDLAHKSFIMALCRLRDLLGVKEALSFLDGRVTLDPQYCWVDIWAFERILGTADAAIREGRKESAVHLMEKAITMYHGPFLSADEEPWATAMRERLGNKVLHYLKILSGLYEEEGNLRGAIDTFKKGIEIDPLAEDLYQRIMTCYDRLGCKAEALAAYHSFKKILFAIHGAAPSPITEAILKNLLII
jgi:DNA-binding SARP family transcriptional activator